MEITAYKKMPENVVQIVSDAAKQIGYHVFYDEWEEDFECYYGMWNGEELISFLSVCVSDDVEITGFTMPQYRKQGYFKTLFLKAREVLLEQGITEIIYTVENGEKAPDYCEYLLVKSIENVEKYKDSGIKYKNGAYYLYEAQKEVAHINIEDTGKYMNIYDVFVEEEYRNKGCATALLSGALSDMKRFGKDVILHVNSTNQYACKLYFAAGFEILQQLDYYRYRLG